MPEQVLDSIHGSWLTQLEWEEGVLGGKLHHVWDYERSVVRRPKQLAAEPLPSDCRWAGRASGGGRSGGQAGSCVRFECRLLVPWAGLSII